jgi:transposase
MIRFELSQEEHEAISEALDDPSIEERHKRRLLAIRMHQLNVPHGVIARTLSVSDDTITNYLKLYQTDGLSGLLENRYYQPVSQIEPFLDQIAQSLEQDPVATANEAAERIRRLTQVELSESQARRIMRRLGLAYRKSAGVPGKADPQMQFDFLAQELLPRLEEARQGERRVFFVDAAHFVLGAFLGMIWCFVRVFIPTGSGRQRYNVLGAVETRDHQMVSIRTTGSINAQTVCELQEMIHERYPNEAITLVMDNARYQYNRAVKEQAEALGIELLYLPTYSPNLNLIERVWKLVKAKCLRNRYHENFPAFCATIDSFIDSLDGKNKHLLKSLLTENFHIPAFPKS